MEKRDTAALGPGPPLGIRFTVVFEGGFVGVGPINHHLDPQRKASTNRLSLAIGGKEITYDLRMSC